MSPFEPLLPYARLLGVLLLAAVAAAVLHLSLRFGLRLVVTGVVRSGLYSPDPSAARESTPGTRDRGIRLFTVALRRVSAVVPGNPRTNPLTLIIPVLVVAGPLTFVLVAVFVALPLALAGFVAGLGPSRLAVALGGLGLAGYYGAFLVALHLWKQLPERPQGAAATA